MNIDEQKNNYDILGLPDGSDKEAVERKYGALLRQYKHMTDEKGGPTYDDLDYYNKITFAYNSIMGYSVDFAADDNPSSSIPRPIRRFGGKVCTFFDQYKLLLICGILIIAGAMLVFFQIRDAGREDLSIKFVGAYASLNNNAVEEYINEKSITSNDASVGFFTVTTSTEMSNIARSQAETFYAQIYSGDLDIVLIDKDSFDVYVKKMTFMRLDEFVGSNYAGRSDLTLYEYGSEEGDEIAVERDIYGIDVTDAAFFADLPEFAWQYDQEAGQSKSMILTICRKTKRPEAAQDFAKEVIDTLN